MTLIRQDVLVDPPSASDTVGTPSDVVPWVGEYEEISLIMEYQAYAVGTFTMYIQSLLRADDGAGGYTDTWVDWSIVPIQDVYGSGYGNVRMPFHGTTGSVVVGVNLTPAFSAGDPTSGIPRGPLRILPVSGSGITKSGAFVWCYFEGIKKR